MIGASEPYCLVTIKVDWEQREDVYVLRSFEEVDDCLRRVYDWFAEVMSEARAVEEAPPTRVSVGGFGVNLQNRWGGEVEVGVGRSIWFLFQNQPQPSRCFSDNPQLDGSLVFYLDGGHYTELGRESLVSSGRCLAALRQWLDAGELPTTV